MAEALWKDPTLQPEIHAEHFINVEKGIETIEAALEGARQNPHGALCRRSRIIGRITPLFMATCRIDFH